jgi:hypothetical protein
MGSIILARTLGEREMKNWERRELHTAKHIGAFNHNCKLMGKPITLSTFFNLCKRPCIKKM